MCGFWEIMVVINPSVFKLHSKGLAVFIIPNRLYIGGFNWGSFDHSSSSTGIPTGTLVPTGFSPEMAERSKTDNTWGYVTANCSACKGLSAWIVIHSSTDLLTLTRQIFFLIT